MFCATFALLPEWSFVHNRREVDARGTKKVFARFLKGFFAVLPLLIGLSPAFAAKPADLFQDMKEKLDREALEQALEAPESGQPLGEVAVVDEQGWKRVSSKEGGFDVLMPGEPSFTHTIKDTRVGEVEENLFEYASKAGDFAVEYTDLPGIAVLLGGTKAILRKVKGELLKNEKGKQVEYFRIKQEGEKGAELAYTTQTQVGRARFFLVDKRLYVVVASVAKQGGDTQRITAFLDSFSFSKRTFQRKPHKYIDIQQDTLLE